jgi:hypothetical protein
MDDHDRGEAQALRDIAEILAARGLEVTETTSADGLPELAITNPADPAKGRMYVGYEGYLIWEYWAPASARSADSEIIGTVTAMLSSSTPLRLSWPRSHVRSPVRHGEDDPFVSQPRHCPACRIPANAVGLHQRAFRRQRVEVLQLAVLDHPVHDARELDVQGLVRIRVDRVLRHGSTVADVDHVLISTYVANVPNVCNVC